MTNQVPYSDAQAAELYNVLNAWGPSDDFYLSLVMAAPSVLDVGCGTGMMLHRARALGHQGRLLGIDPDAAALDVARRRDDVEWVEGTAASMHWRQEFHQAVMMSHAFQCLVSDDDIQASLTAIRAALVDGGRFTFETRNPRVRSWERWNPDHPTDVTDADGRQLRIIHQVESVEGDAVTFTETTSELGGPALRTDRTILRFLDLDTLSDFLTDAGFVIEGQSGGWFGEPLEPASREMIITARAA
ncbi:class I SAM-dependent methyltransferase [Arthrobacter rhizosphaerae]|uniref:class I SAM-dependent methyltransferase n=1 Tax=Arthrobacter rhizosphaerae TaxID=2855490 RepID=UPI001FF68A5D|nr:class I SAM-dependent methyltransferase [Arthrobacter rhizosphaerae]